MSVLCNLFLCNNCAQQDEADSLLCAGALSVPSVFSLEWSLAGDIWNLDFGPVKEAIY